MKQFYKKLTVILSLAVFCYGGEHVAAESCPAMLSAPIAQPAGWEGQTQLKLPFAFVRVSSGSAECFYTSCPSGIIPISKACSKATMGAGSWKKVGGTDEHECKGRCAFTCH